MLPTSQLLNICLLYCLYLFQKQFQLFDREMTEEEMNFDPSAKKKKKKKKTAFDPEAEGGEEAGLNIFQEVFRRN